MPTFWLPLGHFFLACACLVAAAIATAGCTKAQDIHETPEVKGQPCINCHAQAFVSAANPKHIGVFPETCGSCHNTKKWIPATPSGNALDHPWFPLANAHAKVACTACHTKGYQMGDTPKACVGCHQKDYDAAMSPPHAGLPTTCDGCHNAKGWQPSTFVHPWTLDGKHAVTPCVSCHTGTPPRYPGTPTACVGCHLADFQ